jgi:phospholipid transport system substrate-binding protein
MTEGLMGNTTFSEGAIKGLAAALVVCLHFACASLASAEEDASSPGPREVVAAATDNIMALAREAPAYFDTDPDRYTVAVGEELDRVVDFRGFARGVMGRFASKELYQGLDEAGRNQLREHLMKFTEVLRSGMVNTYSRGLLAFGGSQVELGEVDMAPGSTRVASVTQRVFGDDGKIYTVKYQMGQYRDGRWKLRNLIIENINLGEIYRGQFEAAALEAGGDLDTVIANWDDNRVKSLSTEK